MSETLIVALAGILATLLSSLIGHYYVHQARAAPLRERLYTQQFELLQDISRHIGRIENFEEILTGENEEYRARAIIDVNDEFPKLNALVDSASLLLPVELWIECRQFLANAIRVALDYEQGGTLEEATVRNQVKAQGAKVMLMARELLGSDELTAQNLKLFTKPKRFEMLSNADFREDRDSHNG